MSGGTPSPACDACGSEDRRLLLRGTDRRHGVPGEYAIVRCGRCGLARTEPRPADVGAAYPDDEYMNHQERVDLASRIFAGALRRSAAGRLPRAATRIVEALVPAATLGGPLPRGARLLDVGCGTGHGVAALRAAGVDAHGIEPDAGAVDVARSAGIGTVRVGTLETERLDPGAWDVVRFWHTLEHVPSPSEALRRAHEGLAPGGRVVVGVPNLDSAARFLLGRNWDGLELPRHLHHFTRGTLAAMLRGAGFADVTVRSVAVMGVLTGSIDAATRREPRQRTGPGWALARFALHPLEIAVAAAGYGDGVVAVGRVPAADGQTRVPVTSTIE